MTQLPMGLLVMLLVRWLTGENMPQASASSCPVGHTSAFHKWEVRREACLQQLMCFVIKLCTTKRQHGYCLSQSPVGVAIPQLHFQNTVTTCYRGSIGRSARALRVLGLFCRPFQLV